MGIYVDLSGDLAVDLIGILYSVVELKQFRMSIEHEGILCMFFSSEKSSIYSTILLQCVFQYFMKCVVYVFVRDKFLYLVGQIQTDVS